MMSSPRPIAIVGRSLRFPGASSASELHDLLRHPRDLLEDFPPLRMNKNAYYHPDGDHHATTNVRQSYFVAQDHRVFDAPFFNISPVEAEAMDPQQRILLEMVYEALESAGMTIKGLQGSRTSVFVGVMSSDFSTIQRRDEDTIPAHALTGTASSILSNRISYFFDWKGASMTIDTACSSSLVALHLAVQSLRNGESDVAVVAGTNLMLSFEPFIAESTMHMLSPTSRSRMWDAQADGYARGEGFAVVVLSSLDRAIQNHDPIRSIIRESLVNTDGRTTGLTVPNAAAQAALIRATYQRAGLDCQREQDRCQYFEAHGTGTPTGDPIEAEAIATAFFPLETSSATSLYVGSIKTVVGHLEGCAGLAGVLKASIAVEKGVIPPNLHFQKLNPAIEPFYQHLKIPLAAEPWPELAAGAPRRASVNSFGFGGANAHVIVESYEPAKEDLDARPSVPQVLGPLVISAQSSAVLMKRIQSLSRYLQSEPSVDFDNLTTILQLHRTVFTVRASFVGATAECLAEFMNAYVQQQTDAKTPSRRDSHGPPQILGIFTGQGAQWPQMGRELVLTSPVFADCLSELQRSLDTLPDCPSWSLREELLAEDALSRVHDPVVGQPLCTAVQIGLVNLLHSAGLKFNKVVGHSSGEIAAAYAGGFLSAADAIRVSYYRGLHVENECSNSGAMAAVQMAYSEAQELCQSGCFAGRVVVAASNAPSIVTLSGDADAIQEIKELLADTTPMKQLHVNHAYHSHHMNRAAESYAKSLRACKIEVHSGRPDCAWISSVKPGMTIQTDRMLQVSYWVENLIKPVLFSQAVTEVVCDPCTIDAIFEVGPHPALQAPVAQIVRENGGRAIHYDALLQRGHASTETFAKALGELWVHLGADAHIDFAGFHKAFAKKIPSAVQRARLLDALPGYPWDHQRLYWKESRISANYRLHSNPRHCLLGHRRPDDSKHDMRWRNILRLNEVPWLRGHSFQGEAVFPAAGYISMAVDASQSLVSDGCGMTVEIRDLEILHALVLRDDLVGMEVLFSLQVNPASDIGTVTASFVCASGLSRPDADFRVNARGQVSISVNKTGLASDAVLPLRTQMLRAMLAIDSTQLYRTLGALGLEYSGLFRALVDVQRTTRMSTARASWSSSELDSSMRIHPAVLDTGFQAIFASVGSVMGLHHPYLPTSIAKIRVKVPPVDFRLETDVDIMIETYVTEVARRPSDWMPVIAADLDIFSDKQYRVQVEGLTLTPMSAAEPANDRKIYYQTVWEDDISNSLQLQSIENGYERKGSLDDTELPELLERLSHIYLREIFASVSPEKITTFEWYHQRFFEYMKDLFTCIDQGRHPIIKQQWTRDTKQLLFTEISRFPETIDLICVNTVARHMPDVLAGKLSMLEVLAENDKLTRLYDEGLMTSRVYSCITQMARQLSHRYPRLRVLEIGAGTGATTRRVLEGLQGAFSTYVYSDISAGFFEKAKTHITHWAGKMEFRTFDIEQDPDGQGLPTHTYDLVIASSVLHATRFVRKSLAHTRRLLRPGGYLLLLEPTSCSVRVPYLMGGLPGWWLGGEDGRRLHPGLTPIQWDQAMRNVGFSGIDNLCSDTDEPTKHIYSLMATQALDDRVTMLREPLSALKSLPKPTQLLIIGGQTLPVSRLVSKLSTLLAQWQRSIVFVASLEALSSSIDVLQGATVLCLADLDQPIFQSITASIFHSLQKLFNHAGRVLWVTKHCHTNSPYSNMMIGLVRVLSNEMVHLDVQMLDLQNSHLNLQSHAYDIAHALIRLSMKESLGDDVLWSTEPELALRDGTLRIPRLRQDQALNDRLNANWRYILTKAPMEGQIFQLSHQHRRWSIDLQDSPPGRRQSIEGGETFTIQMDLSSLHPVEIYPGMSLYVGIGLVQTTGEKVVTLARSNASFITTCRNWTWPCVAPEHEQEQNLNSIIAALLSQRILLSMAKDTTLLLIHSSTSQLIAQKLTHMARSRGVQVSCMTSQGSLPENGQDCIQIHPYATMRQVRTILPRNVTRAVSLAVTRQNRENQHILACLPSYVETIELSSYLKDRSQVDLGLDAPTVESFVTTVIREAQACPHSSSTIELFPLSSPSSIAMRSDVPRSSIVDWRGEVSYPVTVRPLAPGNLLSTDKTYFLVGLTGELGKSLARWMIIHGARYLVLSSRRGLVDAVWLEEMHNMGAHVIVYAMDVTEFSSLKSVYEKVQRIMPPIGGVVNGAMVLADALFTDMTFEALVTALRPKVDGSRNLDSLFRGPDLEFFILLSSVSAVTGFRGQSNYAAGNMFMAGLVAQRRSQGLVGSVLDLGMLAELGYVARAGAAMQEYLQHKYSITPIYEPDFHQMFAEAIVAGRPNSPHLHEIITGVQALQVDQILDRTPWLDNPRFSHLLLRDTNVTSQTTSSQGIPIAHMMTNAQNRDEAVSALQAGLVARLSTILQIDPSEVSLQLPLVNIGVDSLVAIDIRSWLIRELKLDIPALRIVGGITLIELADEVVTKLFWKEGAMHENSQSPSEQETREKSADAPEVDGTHSGEGKTTDSQSSDALTFMSTGKSDEAVVSETQSHSMNDADIIEEPIDVNDRWKLRDVNFLSTKQDNLHKMIPPRTASIPFGIVLAEPLSYSQARQWFLMTSSDTPAHYNVVLAYEINGALSMTQFQQAFQSVIARHQAFRTCFFIDASTGETMQGILQKSRSTLNCRTLANEDEVQGEFDRIKNHVFQLEQGEVFLATLLQKSPSQSILIFGYSHILMDGTSVFLFLDDLDKAYRRIQWEGIPTPYTDFAISQRSLVESKQVREDFEYWKNLLSPLPHVLPLLDICRVQSRPTTSAESATHTVHASIPGIDVLALRKKCRDLGITPFHFYLTVLHVLLSKFLTAIDDYCIGIADANRVDERWMRTIGNFLNLLPLRFHNSHGQESFQESAKNTSQQVLSALSHSSLPFELLLEELDIPRSVSNTPLFQVFMNYRMNAFKHMPLGDCQVQHRIVSDANLGYDIFVTVTEPSRTSCVVSMTVRADLYTQPSAQLLLDVYCHLLGQVTKDPSKKLQDYTLYNDIDAQSVILLGQGARQNFDLPHETLQRKVQRWSQETPNKIAVRDMYGNALSYDMIHKKASSLAVVLSSAGVTKGAFVAVLMHPCSITIISLLAILRLGAVYVPLDLSNPPERLAQMVHDCDPAAIICQQNTKRLAEGMLLRGRIIIQNHFTSEDMDNRVLPTNDCSLVNEPAFAFYTSGSTGTPKGVLISQASFLHAVDVTRQASITTDDDVILQQSSLGFDLSLYQIIHALAYGATLIMVPPALRRNPSALAKVMVDHHITVTIATPSEYCIMLAYGMHYLQQCMSWRLAAFAGENMGNPVKQLFRQLHSPSLVIQNWFGPTEVGVYAIDPDVPYHEIKDTDLEEYPSIRRPVPNMDVYIIDQHLRPLAPGFAGEICVGGPNTAISYINDPLLTAEKFIPNRLATEGGSVSHRLYRTGDKGRLLADGTIVFLGRMDGGTMVKLRGFRLDLNEVASSILHAAGGLLTDAVADLRGDPPALIAFVVVFPDRSPPDVASYLENLTGSLPLPDYMCPSMILPLVSLPTTPNGKRDRAALALIPLPTISNERDEVPLSDVATTLKELWLRLLPSILTSSQIHHDTGFFRLGGSSILLIKLQALIEETFQVKITVLKLFQLNTLGGMAASIEADLQHQHQRSVAYADDSISETPEENPLAVELASEDDISPRLLPPLAFEEEINWENETALPKEVWRQPTSESRLLPSTGRIVLLTGSTGLLGRALLARLVKDPSVCKIHCIAVPLLSEFRHISKVTSYVGKLSMPSLGLSTGEMGMLAQEVDLIVHASVDGSFLDSYQTIRQNTLGAVRCLAAIAGPRRIPFHLVSSSRVLLFTGAASLGEVTVSQFHPPTDGSEGLAASRWACERYLENVSEALAVPVHIHRCCAMITDNAPPSDVLNSIIKYTRALKAVPNLENTEGFIDFMPLETIADEITETFFLPLEEERGPVLVRFSHHTSGNQITPKQLRQYFENKEHCSFMELELTEWLKRAQTLGLSDFAVAVLDSLRSRAEPVFFPLLLKIK